MSAWCWLGDHHVALVELATPLVIHINAPTPLVVHINALALLRHRGLGQRRGGSGREASRALSWGIGMWAIIFPLINLPFLSCIGFMWRKARKLEL